MIIVACPAKHPLLKAKSDLRVVLFDRSRQARTACTGATLHEVLRKSRLTPAPRAWDLLAIALAVNAVDWGCSRDGSPDGWTRYLQLTIAVQDPAFWSGQADVLQSALRFLTTDIWQLAFVDGGHTLKAPQELWAPEEKSVVLVSGGLDSLSGAITVAACGKPMAASQVSNGDKTSQRAFAAAISGGLSHLQLNHNIELPGPGERSQRARSLIFLAYGVLAATSLAVYQQSRPVPLYMPENGFISINPPLTPMRLGSLSTRTTHPAFLRRIQTLLDAAGLAVRIENPFQFKTKGELLAECPNQPLLRKLASQSTSCGRYARNGFTHCGRCVPCLIRRSAFHRWQQEDRTKYVYANLARRGPKHSGFDDVRALGVAMATVAENGLDAWLGQSLNSRLVGDPAPFKETVARGLEEVQTFLRAGRIV